MRRLIAGLALTAAAANAVADEAAIRRMLAAKLRTATVESVSKTPVAGLYEVALRGAEGLQLLYVDEKASVILSGPMFDARSDRNLTEERLRKLSAINWNSLPFEWAITTVRGSGRRRIAVFSDPYCPYCKSFESDLAKLDDITVHIFLYPVIRPESLDLTRSVWCSQDRAKAWNDLMLRDVRPVAASNCMTPIEKIVALGKRLGANATPAWLVTDGELHQGALPLADLRALLDASVPRGAKARK